MAAATRPPLCFFPAARVGTPCCRATQPTLPTRAAGGLTRHRAGYGAPSPLPSGPEPHTPLVSGPPRRRPPGASCAPLPLALWSIPLAVDVRARPRHEHTPGGVVRSRPHARLHSSGVTQRAHTPAYAPPQPLRILPEPNRCAEAATPHLTPAFLEPPPLKPQPFTANLAPNRASQRDRRARLPRRVPCPALRCHPAALRPSPSIGLVRINVLPPAAAAAALLRAVQAMHAMQRRRAPGARYNCVRFFRSPPLAWQSPRVHNVSGNARTVRLPLACDKIGANASVCVEQGVIKGGGVRLDGWQFRGDESGNAIAPLLRPARPAT